MGRVYRRDYPTGGRDPALLLLAPCLEISFSSTIFIFQIDLSGRKIQKLISQIRNVSECVTKFSKRLPTGGNKKEK